MVTIAYCPTTIASATRLVLLANALAHNSHDPTTATKTGALPLSNNQNARDRC